MEIMDTIIIGGGPAGLSAGLYSSRGGLKTLIIEKGRLGGQIVTTSEVENYPGSIENCTGPLLIDRMKEQNNSFGTIIKQEVVEKIVQDKEIFKVRTNNNQYLTRTIIITTGAEPRMLGCKGEEEFRGLGVSYCATCDAGFFKDLNVVVVGGGDTAVDEGIYLTKFAKKVTIIHRRDQLRAAKSLQEKAFKNEKIDFRWNSTVEEIKGKGIVQSIVLKNKITGEITELPTDGVFMFVGYKPISDVFNGLVEMDDYGYIIGDEKMNTSIKGIFVAGDVRKKGLRQVITAAADGAIAAVNAEKYISSKFE